MCYLLMKLKLEIEALLNHEVDCFEVSKYNQAYDACTFRIRDESITYRRAKLTPVKEGAFVVIWLKDDNRNNRPYTVDEFSDNLIVFVKSVSSRGYFNFPKSILESKQILHSKNSKGKMAFRVYPHAEGLNKLAFSTYQWQKEYYYPLKNS